MAEIKGSQTIKGITYNTGSSVTLNRSAKYHTSADGTNAKNLSGLSTSSEYYPDTFVGYSTTYDYAPYHVSYNTSWEGYWFTKDAFPEASITINYYSNGADYCTFEGKQVSVGSNTKVASDTFYYETTDSNGLANVQNSSYLYLSRTGYSATGNWGTSTNGGTLIGENESQSGKTLANKLGVDVSSGSGSKNLYAQWTPNTYIVTFNANEGETSIASKEATYDFTYGDLPTPIKIGYTFDGWYDADTDGNLITSETKVSTASNHTLYAHWTAIPYTITYDPNGGDLNGIPQGQIYTYEDAYVALHSSKPVRIGYTFVEWNTSKDGTGTTKYHPSDEFEKVAEDTTLYAIWRENVLLINYKSNYATYALVDGVENTEVSADQKDIVVRTSEYKYATPIPNGLHKYSSEGDDTYMKRTRYDATGYWGIKSGSEEELEEGFVSIHENTPFESGAKLAEALGDDVLSALEAEDVEIDLYALWVLLASRITVFDENGNAQKGLVHIYTDNMNFITADSDVFKDVNEDYFITGAGLRYGIITIFDSDGIARMAI